MPLLTSEEAFDVSDSFLSTLYGDDIFRRWKELKDEMKFIRERDYVSWLIDIANHYNKVGTEPLMQNNLVDGEDKHFQLQCLETDVAVENDVVKLEEVDADDGDAGTTLASGREKSESFAIDSSAPHGGDESEEQQPEDVGRAESAGEMYSDIDLSMTSAAAVDDQFYIAAGDAVSVPVAQNMEEAAAAGVAGLRNPRRHHSCPHCGYRSLSRSHVTQHILSTHERHKPFSCPHCPYTASVRPTLTQHLIYKHGYMGKHCCSHCGKSYPRRRDLHMHVRRCVGAPAPPAATTGEEVDGGQANTSLLSNPYSNPHAQTARDF